MQVFSNLRPLLIFSHSLHFLLLIQSLCYLQRVTLHKDIFYMSAPFSVTLQIWILQKKQCSGLEREVYLSDHPVSTKRNPCFRGVAMMYPATLVILKVPNLHFLTSILVLLWNASKNYKNKFKYLKYVKYFKSQGMYLNLCMLCVRGRIYLVFLDLIVNIS